MQAKYLLNPYSPIYCSKPMISIISLPIDLQANCQEIYEGSGMNMCTQVSLGQTMAHGILVPEMIKPQTSS